MRYFSLRFGLKIFLLFYRGSNATIITTLSQHHCVLYFYNFHPHCPKTTTHITTMPSTDQAEEEQAGNPAEKTQDLSTKRLRCQAPDVVVVVGPDGEEFPCYRIVLSLSSAVFDAMLSIAMVENEQRLRQAARNIKRYFSSLGINSPAT